MKLKWLFGTLILLNLGLWMWGVWYKPVPPEENRTARAPIAPEQMRLLTEPGVKLVPRAGPLPANAALLPNVAPACFRIGPFAEMALVAQAETQLVAWHLGPPRRSEETRMVTSYLAYLPMLASREEAERKRAELTRLGFKDHALMQDEIWHNAISLGLFAVEANAENRVSELAAKGVYAKVKPISQNRIFYWLDFTARVSAEDSVKLKRMDWGAPDIQTQEITCPAANNPPLPPASPPPGKTPA